MCSDAIKQELSRVAARFSGRGVIVECGSYLGATLKIMSDAIGNRPAEFHLFERFQPNEYEIRLAAECGVELSNVSDSRAWICENVLPSMPRRHDVHFHRGPLVDCQWGTKPIEIFVLDAAKLNPHFQHVIDTFRPAWLTRASVCLLDAFFKEHDPQRSCQRDWLAANYPNFTRAGSGAFFTA